jgi:A/G-specific adenine glycosylase
MLQQTRAETVAPYYLRFLARFPTIEALAAAPLEAVLASWSGLGYYRRARSLHAGARSIVAEHGGEFPRDLAAALAVPGVGPYTAGAVLSIAYNLPVPVVDGNVERVLTRLHRLRGDPRQARQKRTLRALAAALIPAGRASEFNQALMELGAMVCKPVDPDCDRCPVATACLARRAGDARRFPEKARERRTVKVTLHAALVRDGGRWLLEERREPGYLQGLWLFPSLEAPDGDGAGPQVPAPPCRELVADLEARLGVRFTARGLACSVGHAITYRRIMVRAFYLEPADPERCARAVAADPRFRWAAAGELGDSVAVSSIVLKVKRALDGERGEVAATAFPRKPAALRSSVKKNNPGGRLGSARRDPQGL